MKNDPKGLSKIINGKLIIPFRGKDAYIAADAWNSSEFILIPDCVDLLYYHPKLHTTTGSVRKNNPWREAELIIPGFDDVPMLAWCYILNNKVFAENNFTWVGDQVSGCWAYYPKKLCT